MTHAYHSLGGYSESIPFSIIMHITMSIRMSLVIRMLSKQHLTIKGIIIIVHADRCVPHIGVLHVCYILILTMTLT